MTVEQIINRVGAFEVKVKHDRYRAEFETTDPSAVSVFDHDAHKHIHERMNSVSEWVSFLRVMRMD